MMNCVLWNCRGANKPNFRRSIRYLIKKFNIDVLALFQTHAGGDKAKRICQGLGFSDSHRVDAVGQSGGIWLLWKPDIGEISIEKTSDQFIHAKVTKGLEIFHLIVVYAAPTVSRRSNLWNELRMVIQRIQEPMFIGGDFNTIVRLDERIGGNGRLSQDSHAFGSWVNDLSLIDLGFKGSRYTWKRGRTESNFVAKRLDRVLCCGQARLKWQEATVTHLPFFSSDHTPLYVQLCPVTKRDPRRRPFRFEAAWLQHPEFKDMVQASWRNNIATPVALKELSGKLKKWNREVFGDVHKRKEALLNEIKKVQDLLDVAQTDELLKKEADMSKEFDVILEQEEMLWFQKSREKWIVHGDRNTSYFHTSTIIRRRRNRIESLKNDAGQWVSNNDELERMAVDYYKSLYSLDDVPQIVVGLAREGFPCIADEDMRFLNKPFVEREIVEAIGCMGKFKAPGPDGFQPIFYQQCWEVVGPSVTRLVLDFFESGILHEGLNDALIVLIAKVTKPEKITQFRPISLCNVLFKTMTKMMVTRLKRVMPLLIGPAQSSFIPGRLSTDNIVIVQEVVHSMRRKKGKKGWMLLKLDLEKAYDRVRWEFLEDTLYAAGLSCKWVEWIMTCVKEPSMNVLWNGERTECFKPLRGLRQGDPLSPYLFVLCLERLCHLIHNAVEGKEWKPISISRGGPKLSHICFADDLILFAEASVAQIRVIRRVLETFCNASGQKVSLEKSKVFFSSNVSRENEARITAESGIQATRDLGKYLGMPILQKRINKDTFRELLEKSASRLAGWKGSCLSLAGRVTLTKAVLAAIPTHTMSSILLPGSTLKSLDKLSRAFIWGSTIEKKKQHLVSWNKVCLTKQIGGLGVRSAKEMNKALIAKLGWRLLNNNDSLWAMVLRKKYKVGLLRDTAWLVPKSTWSSTWRSVGVGLREVVVPSVRWVIGNGSDVRFWKDKWLADEPLMDTAILGLPAEDEDVTVAELWRDGIGWDMARIMPFMNEEERLELSSVIVDNVTGAKDRLSWGGRSDGQFSVKSAYMLITHDASPTHCSQAFFDRIWKVVAPERVRMFLWLVGNQAIMTNMERLRRHMSDTGVCQVCKGGYETILHILRDCPAMHGIWTRIVPQRKQSAFFSQPLLEWVYFNLGGAQGGEESPWATLFALGIWWGWKWRCGNVFGVNGKCRDRVMFIKDAAREVTAASLKERRNITIRPRETRHIAWTPPQHGWLKINTDGASRGNPGRATAGGVLRDANGDWCGGFALNIGKCTAPLAELWGVYYGLYIAWEKRVTCVEVEVDSEMVVGFLKKGITEQHSLSFLVRLCYGFISKDWNVRISHIYREANVLADSLANHAFDLPLGFCYFDSCPNACALFLQEDANGTTRPRDIRL